MVKYTYIHPLRVHFKKDQQHTYLMMFRRFYLIFFIKAYAVGTHLNCIDLVDAFLYKSIRCGHPFELHRQVDAIQMSTHNICLYKEV